MKVKKVEQEEEEEGKEENPPGCDTITYMRIETEGAFTKVT